MDLIVRNKIILSPIEDLLKKLQSQLDSGKLKDIVNSKDEILVTCPVHKDGKENNPSCHIFNDNTSKDMRIGTCHCFSCNFSGNFIDFVCACFNREDKEFGEEWLLQNADIAFQSEVQDLPEIDIDKRRQKKEFLDESILNNYKQYHPYMWTRKLSKEIVDLFDVGYDKNSNSITFPVRDEFGRLLFITKRNVENKFFYIPSNVEKPVYLLYYALQLKLNRVAVVESQINALYLWSLHIPAVALFGLGTDKQYDILNRSGIRVFDLFFDGDNAGRKGEYRFKKNMRKDVIINTHRLPDGKDVNDLDYEKICKLVVF